MFQNKAIDRLWILRTLLYYTDYTLSSEAEAVINLEIETEKN